MTMELRHFFRTVAAALSNGAWLATIGPFCVASDLPSLGTPVRRSLNLVGQDDNYPITELLGRLLAFRARLRVARSTLIVSRAIVLGVTIVLLVKIGDLAGVQVSTPWLLLTLFLLAGWALHLSLHHPISPFEVARFIDRRENLQAQIATAVESTIADRLDRPLVRAQVRLATNSVRSLDPSTTIPMPVPWRDVRALGGVAALLAAILVGARLGVSLPRQVPALEAELAKQARVQAQSPSPFVTIDPSIAMLQPPAPRVLNQSTANAQVNKQLDVLQQQMQSRQITPDQFQNQLRQVQQQIQSTASESLAAQEALNALATSLKDTSATQAISDSLMRGDYKKASDGLNQLSTELPQLSPDARAQLADRLGQASAKTQTSSPTISKDAGQAATGLKNGDAAGATQALQSLAQSVDQAQQKISAQSQLGQSLQDVQKQLGQSLNPSGNQPSSQSNPASTTPGSSDQTTGQNAQPNSPPSASRTDSRGSGGPSDSSANNPLADSNGGQGRAAVRSSGTAIQQDQAGNSGGVGDQPGGSPLGQGSSLDVRGVKLTIIGKSSGSGSSTTSAGDRSVPLTAGDNGSLNGLPSSGSVPSNLPITAHQDSSVVPLDRKPVVRDYFTDAPP